jgi:hypothetical protein
LCDAVKSPRRETTGVRTGVLYALQEGRRSMRIADMTWMQVEERVRSDDRCVLPIGF